MKEFMWCPIHDTDRAEALMADGWKVAEDLTKPSHHSHHSILMVRELTEQ